MGSLRHIRIRHMDIIQRLRGLLGGAFEGTEKSEDISAVPASPSHVSGVEPSQFSPEIETMLGQDMTLAEAVDYHINEVWGFTEREGFDHEAGHILLGLAFSEPVVGQYYEHQGNYESEIYNFRIENILLPSMVGRSKTLYDDREDFHRQALVSYQATMPIENLNRTLGWILEQKTGQSYAELRDSVGYDDGAFRGLAREHGLMLEVNELGQDWALTIPENGVRFHCKSEEDLYLPDDIDGVTDFARFERPTDEVIDTVYDRILPAAHVLQQRIFDARSENGGTLNSDMVEEAMGAVKVRALYEAMYARPAPALTMDAIPS